MTVSEKLHRKESAKGTWRVGPQQPQEEKGPGNIRTQELCSQLCTEATDLSVNSEPELGCPLEHSNPVGGVAVKKPVSNCNRISILRV